MIEGHGSVLTRRRDHFENEALRAVHERVVIQCRAPNAAGGERTQPTDGLSPAENPSSGEVTLPGDAPVPPCRHEIVHREPRPEQHPLAPSREGHEDGKWLHEVGGDPQPGSSFRHRAPELAEIQML
jgi:hypothetical protein